MGPNEAYACVGGLYLTVADSLAPLPINDNNEKNFQTISNCVKQRRSSQIFLEVSGVFEQDFNGTKNNAVLEPRAGQFSRFWGFETKVKDLTFGAKAKDFKMCPRGLHLCSLRWIMMAYFWFGPGAAAPSASALIQPWFEVRLPIVIPIRGEVLANVLGLENTFWSPWPLPRSPSPWP